MAGIGTNDGRVVDERVPPEFDIASYRNSNRQPPRQPPSRLRSGSLGSAHHGHSKIDLLPQNPMLTILVVGARGCGKSAAIQKGTKGFKLGDPVPLELRFPIPGTSQQDPYICRTGHTLIEGSPQIYTLKIIEAQIDPRNEASFSAMPENWPPALPAVDGVLVCYDVSSPLSFQPVEPLLRGYRQLKLPTVVLACKTDLAWEIDPDAAYRALQEYHNGLIEVSNVDESGKDKMKKAFDWILKAALRHRRTYGLPNDSDYHNPASPDILKSASPWSDASQSATPTPTPSISSLNLSSLSPIRRLPQSQSTSPLSGSPATPTRTRSTGDLLMESERARSKSITQDYPRLPSLSRDSQAATTLSTSPTSEVPDYSLTTVPSPNEAQDIVDDSKVNKDKEARPAHWATLDELLDKLLFLAVSGDDPMFISNFLLTYRRFATPRAILLAMQKRMRQLDSSPGDSMFACYAQMKICHLLETWIHDYPYDFAVRGTHGALNALVKSILSKTYLLHYGSDFLPFIETLVDRVDRDSSWAVLPDDVSNVSDDYNEEDEPHSPKVGEFKTASGSSSSPERPPTPPARDRKSSLPLMAKTNLISGPADSSEPVPRALLKDLQRVANEINAIDSHEIAQEITRREVEAFLAIKPRDWLKFTFSSGKKDRSDSLVAFNEASNHLGDWVVSMILCHERPKARARQIEKLVEIAQKLRSMNNYSALRAFVAGIHAATLDDQKDLQARSPEQAKNLQSWRVLLHPARAHRAYRLALRNTKGPCIPALEVHMADLIKANEGNADTDPINPEKIHWGKFHLMGRFVSSTTVCQAQCRSSTEYMFDRRPHIETLLSTPYLLNEDVQHARLSQLDAEYDDGGGGGGGGLGRIGRENSGQGQQSALLRKWFSIVK